MLLLLPQPESIAMPRPILDETQLHPDIRERVARLHGDVVAEVRQAVERHPVVVVGMAQNPFPKRAVRWLREAGIEPHVLSYGSYFSQWRRRNALKMWTGWPTFPMVFVRGTLVVGADEVRRLLDRGELQQLLR